MEAELADIARLDLADAVRDEVVVEELHRAHRAKCRVQLRHVSKSHLAKSQRLDDPFGVPEFTDREVLDAVLTSCPYLHVKLDRILGYIDGNGEEEEDDEADG